MDGVLPALGLMDIEASHPQSLSWQGHSGEPASHEALVHPDLPATDCDQNLVVSPHGGLLTLDVFP